MTTICPDLYVRVHALTGSRAPQPIPTENGFTDATAYRVLGLYSPSETSEAYFILSNDRDEVWFISNRHLRTYAVLPGATALRLPLALGDGAAGHLAFDNGTAGSAAGT
jgi:hypothetical protein